MPVPVRFTMIVIGKKTYSSLLQSNASGSLEIAEVFVQLRDFAYHSASIEFGQNGILRNR